MYQQRRPKVLNTLPLLAWLLYLTAIPADLAAAEDSVLQQPVTELKPFRATYKADFKGMPVRAKAVRELRSLGNGEYLLSSNAKAWFAKIEENSRFTVDENNRLKPLEYQYHRSGIGKNRDAILNFDWQQQVVNNNVQAKPWNMDVPMGALDKLLYQLQLKQDLTQAINSGDHHPKFTYQIADGGKLKEYQFEVLGEEVLNTPAGRFNTIKAQRVRDHSRRSTIFWLAPDYNFLLVQFQQLEDGKGFELFLTEAQFDGKSITGF